MIPKITYGKGFRGALEYCIHKNGASTIGYYPGTDELCELVALLQAKKPEIPPILFMSIGIHPTEYFTDASWEKIGKTMLHRLGYDRNPYAVVKHTDTPHPHIIASRIRCDTGSYPSSKNGYGPAP